MFVVNDLPPPVDPALLDLLVRAEPATIGHFLHTGFMDPGIRGLLPDKRMNFFESGSHDPWPHRFTFVEGPGGCASTVLGFIVFLVVVVVLSRFFF